MKVMGYFSTENNLELFRKSLPCYDHEFIPVNNLSELVAQALFQRPDVVIIELQDKMNGIGEAIRLKNARIPVVVLYSNEGEKVAARESGIGSYLWDLRDFDELVQYLESQAGR